MTFPAHLLDELAHLRTRRSIDWRRKPSKTRGWVTKISPRAPSGLLPESGLGKPDTGADAGDFR